MTAGAGIVHEETHAPAFAESGGLLAGHLPAYANLMQSYNQQSQLG